MEIESFDVIPTPDHFAELERLGDEIAELSAHLDAATARLLGLKPTWTDSMGLGHMTPGRVILWGVVGAVVVTLVFVPLELREKFLKRKHQLADTD